jgi:hypothetical protein
VDELLRKLQDLKDKNSEPLLLRCRTELNTHGCLSVLRTLLKELKPVGQARYDPARACLPGTREDVLEEVIGWSQHTDTLENLLWVHGQVGLGKGAIAASVCEKLEENGLLAVSVFCKRDDPERRDPQRILATIIHGVAVRHSSYAEAVTTAIQDDSLICNSPIRAQYDKLVRAPLQMPTLPVPAASFVIPVDALEECGTTDTRRQLLGYLHMMSQLVPWLKIVVTSHPDPEIKEYFDRSTIAGFSRQDDYLHDASKILSLSSGTALPTLLNPIYYLRMQSRR